MTKKEQYVLMLVREVVTPMVKLMQECPELFGSYFDNGFNSGGEDEIVDADLDSRFTFTAAELESLINVLGDLQNFFQNVAVSAGDRASVLNKMRLGEK